jgi:hypothetical protein
LSDGDYDYDYERRKRTAESRPVGFAPVCYQGLTLSHYFDILRTVMKESPEDSTLNVSLMPELEKADKKNQRRPKFDGTR